MKLKLGTEFVFEFSEPFDPDWYFSEGTQFDLNPIKSYETFAKLNGAFHTYDEVVANTRYRFRLTEVTFMVTFLNLAHYQPGEDPDRLECTYQENHTEISEGWHLSSKQEESEKWRGEDPLLQVSVLLQGDVILPDGQVTWGDIWVDAIKPVHNLEIEPTDCKPGFNPTVQDLLNIFGKNISLPFLNDTP